MSAPRLFVTLVFAFPALFAVCTAATKSEMDGAIKLFSSKSYKNRLLTVYFRNPNKCYDIGCSALDNKIASAKWTGLPERGGIAGDAHIVFYEKGSCGGNSTSIVLPHNGGTADFSKRVKGDISSFMVKTVKKRVDNKVAYVCLWAGAKEVGGTVTEDEPLPPMVIPR